MSYLQQALKSLCLSLSLIVVLFFQSAEADQASEYEQSLKTVSAEINELSRNLNANRKLLKSERDRLAASEQEIVNLKQKIVNIQEEIRRQQQAERGLAKELSALKQQQSADVETLKTLLRHRYQRGQPNYLRMLLNQQNPYAAGRLNNYYRYFSDAQQEKLTEVVNQISAINTLVDKQAAVKTQLEKQHALLEEQKSQLLVVQEKRQESVSKLSNKVEKSSEKLAKLKQDRERLNTLLKALAQKAAELKRLEEQRLAAERRAREQAEKQGQIPPAKPVYRPLVKGGFIKQKGRLKPPVEGKREYGFGTRLAESGMRAQGLFYATNGGQPVHTIFRGRVLFADYLKGYGLLLIIDHGDDHISLYGHNELLYKTVGDVVETGEIIAQSGVSGGLNKPGVYFEIRQNASPVDPAKWLQ